jgi:hypothetical protein
VTGNLTSASQLRNPPLIYPTIDVINLKHERFFIYYRRNRLFPLSVIYDGGIYYLGEVVYLFNVITTKIMQLK